MWTSRLSSSSTTPTWHKYSRDLKSFEWFPRTAKKAWHNTCIEWVGIPNDAYGIAFHFSLRAIWSTQSTPCVFCWITLRGICSLVHCFDSHFIKLVVHNVYSMWTNIIIHKKELFTADIYGSTMGCKTSPDIFGQWVHNWTNYRSVWTPVVIPAHTITPPSWRILIPTHRYLQ